MISRNTVMQRTTVVQSFREILPAENAAIIRRIQLFVPSSPNVYMVVTPDSRLIDQDTGEPMKNVAHAAGFDRSYKGTLLPSGSQIVMHLMPDQALWASCDISYAELGLLVEFLNPQG